MAKILQPAALKIAATHLVKFMREPYPETVAKQVILAYLNEIEKQPKKRHKIHPVTIKMSVLSIGQEFKITSTAHQVLRSRMKTCRILMNNTDARWLCREIDGYTVIKRMQDSELPPGNYCDPAHNKKAVWLAAIPIGESKLAPSDVFPVYKGSIDTNVKIQARKLLDKIDAKWHQRRTIKGIRVWRDI